MTRVFISDGSERGETEFPRRHGADVQAARSLGIVCGKDRPLNAWRHTLGESGVVTLENAEVGHAFFVEQGSINADGRIVNAGQAVSFGPHVSARLRGTSQGSSVLHFFATKGATPARRGGCVHFSDTAPLVDCANNTAHTLFADASCPTCQLWLHRSEFNAPGYFVRPHYHTEDEIIVVTRGTLMLGDRACGPGTALAIDEQAVYSFRAGPDGLAFVNFRDGDPVFVPKVGPGAESRFSERQMFADLRARLAAN